MKQKKQIFNSTLLLLAAFIIIANSCKTEVPIILPTVNTNLEITNITATTAMSGGIITNDNGETVTSRGVCWSTAINPTIKDSLTKDGSGAGAFASNLKNLSPNTSYYLRAYATNKFGTVYGNAMSFTTQQVGGGATFVNIPAGTFTMGSPTSEVNRESDETQYQVTLSAFRMSKYEITNAQYAAFLNAKSIGSNGIWAAGAYPTQTLIYASGGSYNWGLNYTGSQWVPVAGYENHPVIHVTWYGATEFATYAGGRLPTEAQWEYAARGGTTTPFSTGNNLTTSQANYNGNYPYNNNAKGEYREKTMLVGSFAANAYGLHDMHGNVWEWCRDWYGAYPTTAQTNPTGTATGSYRVIRGGSWGNDAQYCRSAYRNYDYPNNDHNDIGFRVVLVP